MNDTTATVVDQDPVAALLPADFRAFHELYYTEMLRYALARTGNRADAEEAVDAAMTRIYEIWDRVLRHEQPLALAYQVLRGKLIDGYRRRRDIPTDFGAPGAPDPPDRAGDIAEEAAAFADLDRALSRLPHRQGACAHLHFLVGLDVAEVAVRLGITASAVRSHLHAARKHLAVALALDPDSPSPDNMRHGTRPGARPHTPARSRKETAT